jgi:small subunit ribosomal protein S3Ae
MFEGVQIGESLADDPEKLKGRIMDVTLQQLTGDFSKMHVKLFFRINNISGSDAQSNFIGHALTSDYIRRLTRRKRSKMDGIYDALTKDGFTIRVKPFAVTEKRIQTSQQRAIRFIMQDVIEKEASEKLVSEFIRVMLSGELSSKIFKESKPIYPIKRVEIRSSEIIGIPEHGPEMKLPEPEEIVEEPEEPKTTEPTPESDKTGEAEVESPAAEPSKAGPEPAVAVAVEIGDKGKKTDEPDAAVKTKTEPKVKVKAKATKPKKATKKTVKKTTAKKATTKKKTATKEVK